MDQCPFCDWREDPDLRDRLVMETTGFVVVAGLGQIVPGYVIVFPKRHVTCLAELTVPELAEFVLLGRQLEEAMVGVYGQWPVFFEHGRAGQTVGHAHVHLAPMAVQASRLMLAMIPAGLPSRDSFLPLARPGDYLRQKGSRPHRELSSLAELDGFFRREGSYLLYEDVEGCIFVFSASEEEVRPGYLREVLAVVVDAPDWADWRKVDPEKDAERLRETRDLLRAYLETAGVPLD